MTFNEIIMSLELGLIYGVIAIGIYLTFRVIGFPDLTCDGSFVLGAAASSMLIKFNFSPWLSLLYAIFAGSIAGIVTGLLYTKFKITDLLAGILVSFMLYSVNLRIMGGVPNISFISNVTIFQDNTLLILLIISLSLGAILTYLLMTNFGLALRSIGQNKKLAHASGINISNMTIIGLGSSNGIIALGGALFSQHQGFADVGSGVGTVIVGFASIMIGEKIMPSRSILVQIISCLIGSIIYRLFISLALHSDVLGLVTADLNLITGILIILIMRIPTRGSC